MKKKQIFEFYSSTTHSSLYVCWSCLPYAIGHFFSPQLVTKLDILVERFVFSLHFFDLIPVQHSFVACYLECTFSYILYKNWGGTKEISLKLMMVERNLRIIFFKEKFNRHRRLKLWKIWCMHTIFSDLHDVIYCFWSSTISGFKLSNNAI